MSREPDDVEPAPEEQESAGDTDGRRRRRGGDQGGEPGRQSAPAGKSSPAEWVSFGISLAILLILVGLLGYEHFTRGNRPPVIEATPVLEDVRQEGTFYYLPVDVANRGDMTAEDVQVQVKLKPGPDQEAETAEFAVMFLAGGETAHGTAVMQHDPAQGELSVAVLSFITP
jgi:uncharacterized protein (TIGR02588 family)